MMGHPPDVGTNSRRQTLSQETDGRYIPITCHVGDDSEPPQMVWRSGYVEAAVEFFPRPRRLGSQYLALFGLMKSVPFKPLLAAPMKARANGRAARRAKRVYGCAAVCVRGPGLS